GRAAASRARLPPTPPTRSFGAPVSGGPSPRSRRRPRLVAHLDMARLAQLHQRSLSDHVARAALRDQLVEVDPVRDLLPLRVAAVPGDLMIAGVEAALGVLEDQASAHGVDAQQQVERLITGEGEREPGA